ncbi:MAG: 50S ribosomal protein L10 [Candidatus Hydrogenedens sp.]|nr:50S ribosomal protein L10 [Candidatus Hydrogenedens sp.]
MPTAEKIATVAEIKARLEESEIAIATQYVGINVENVTALRKKLREAGCEYKVYKNNLTRLALRELDLEGAADYMEGPTAWAFSKDPVAPAKVLKEFAETVKFVNVRGGVLSGSVVSDAQVKALADLPSREQLLAQVVGTIAAPLQNLLGALNGVPRNLVNVIDQIRKQKEEGGAAA